MQSRTLLQRLGLATVVTLTVWAGNAGAARSDVVGPNMMLSEDELASEGNPRGERQAEPDIALDPNDPNSAVAAVQEGRYFDGGAQAIGFSSTSDGGQTWESGLLPGLTEATGGGYERGTDPVVAFGAGGSAYVASLLFDTDTSRQAIALSASRDGGTNWDEPDFVARINSAAHFWDKEWIAVDTFESSPFFGRIYVVWKDFINNSNDGDLLASFSDDAGETWSEPSATTSDRGALGVQPLVSPQGDVHLIYTEDQRLRLVTSPDGTATWSSPRTIAQVDFAAIRDLRTGDFLSSATVDRITGALHVVWQDRRRDPSDIFISSSRDDGEAWSDALKVVRRQGGEAQFTADVAAWNGNVHVIYYSSKDRRSDPDLYNLFYSGSTDAARTFRFPSRVTRRAFDMSYATLTHGGAFLADYVGSAAGPDGVHAAWIDTRRPSAFTDSPGQPDLYAAKITP